MKADNIGSGEFREGTCSLSRPLNVASDANSEWREEGAFKIPQRRAAETSRIVLTLAPSCVLGRCGKQHLRAIRIGSGHRQ